MALIEVKNVKKQYTSGDDVVEALRGVDISIEAGEFITIMGQSGSGKSTLLSVLGGMNHPTTGEIEMAGVKLYQLPGEKLADFRAQNLGFVFQSFNLISYLTAIENVMLPLAIVKMSTAAKKIAARQALLERVGLGGKLDRLPNQLSGGEQERVAIARAIVNNPHILLADEPTGNLDSKTSDEVMALFRELNDAGQTVVMVTHNPENGAYSDRTVILKDGMVVF
ncbi:MAG: ABC transporter ATP-binding protein [Geobacteraceae bacterium GWC2_55_20]|nr:MAG: ABC transporter ATP-binding protein [Geobacteraceae bacterium GWC2_55_20]OGU21801.1 MAG: ABC transporter ATP-binding protein [Geobacteraceae bacterium GWF2_54_21]HBA72021.1 ABC transporter ATP-binding protein [Geobacter sp.]HCE66215.1 ABC transporter ATP-binding protein [Geobacter sp.]